MFVKRKEVLRAIGADGESFVPVKREKGGPPLIPHGVSSRTYRLLASVAGKDGATLFWRGGWKTILGYHAYKHGPRSLPVRDSFGLSPAGTREVMRKALADWRPIPGVQGPRFTISEAGFLHGDAVVVIDLVKLDAALAPDEKLGVPAEKLGELGGRAASMVAARKALQATRGRGVEVLAMPRLAFDVFGRPTIRDGRHRLAALRESGIRIVSVSVPKSEANRFRSRFGARIGG